MGYGIRHTVLALSLTTAVLATLSPSVLPFPPPAAVGTIGLQAAGAAAILLDSSRLFWDVAYNAFGRAPNPAIRICALHAVAAVAGAERAAGARGRAEALLGPDAEDALRAAVFEGEGSMRGWWWLRIGCRLQCARKGSGGRALLAPRCGEEYQVLQTPVLRC